MSTAICPELFTKISFEPHNDPARNHHLTVPGHTITKYLSPDQNSGVPQAQYSIHCATSYLCDRDGI